MSASGLDSFAVAALHAGMGKMLERLKAGSPVYSVEETDGGYVLIASGADGAAFSSLVRDLVNAVDDEFVALPISDGHTGYERVVLLTI